MTSRDSPFSSFWLDVMNEHDVGVLSPVAGWFTSDTPDLLDALIHEDALRQIVAHVTGGHVRLIMLTGAAEDSLARLVLASLENLRGQRGHTAPECVFWWMHGAHLSSDEFFEAALVHLGAEHAARAARSGHARLWYLLSLLRKRRVILVIDGLADIQDEHGNLTDRDLREFARRVVDVGTGSVCILTLRHPISHYGLSDSPHVRTIAVTPLPNTNIPPLSTTDERLLEALSLFRLPIEQKALFAVFQDAALNPDGLERLARLGMIMRVNRTNGTAAYILPAPVRSRYTERAEAYQRAAPLHWSIAEQYLTGRVDKYGLSAAFPSHDVPIPALPSRETDGPSLAELRHVIEAIHHLCCARAHDHAFVLHWEHLYQGQRRTITDALGAFSTNLCALREYFPDGDLRREPGVRTPSARSFVLNAAGLCLSYRGNCRMAVELYERGNAIKMGITRDWVRASLSYRNIAALYLLLSDTQRAVEAAQHALILAEKVEDLLQQRESLRDSLATLAWVSFLAGSDDAGTLFAYAETIERENSDGRQHLDGRLGALHAEYLHRVGRSEDARRIVEKANLERLRSEDVSRFERLRGDLAVGADEVIAGEHYYRAACVASTAAACDVQVEAYLAYGQWLLRKASDPRMATEVLHTALEIAVEAGYTLYERMIVAALANTTSGYNCVSGDDCKL